MKNFAIAQPQKQSVFSELLFLKVLMIGLLLLAVISVSAATKTFNVTSGNWELAGNWLPSGIPNPGDAIIIPSGKTCTITTTTTSNQIFAALTVNGLLKMSSTTLDLPDISADSILGLGTIQLTSANPIQSGKIWMPIMTFTAGTGSIVQTVPAGTYDSLTLNGQKAKQLSGHIKVYGFSVYNDNLMSNAEAFFMQGSCVEFIGAGTTTVPSGHTGAAPYAFVYDSLIIGGGGDKTLAMAYLVVRKYLKVDSGNTMRFAELIDSSGSQFTVAGTGTLKIIGSSGQLPSNRTWDLTVWYSATSYDQTIESGIYNDLNASGYDRTFSGNGDITVRGVFTPGTGTYTIGTSTFKYAGSTNQVVAPISYYNLRLENGNKILPATGTLKIFGAFSPGTLTATPPGLWIEFNGGAQSIPDIIYSKLSTVLAAGNPVSISKTATADLTVTDSLKLKSRLDMGTYKLLGGFVFDPLSSSGVKTACTSSQPLPSGKTWNGTVQYYSTAEQTVVSGSFNILDVGTATPRVFSTDTFFIRSQFFQNTGTYTMTGSTMIYIGGAGQLISGLNYHNLVIGGTGGKAMNGTSTTIEVNGKFHITDTFNLGSTCKLTGTLTTVTGNGVIKTAYSGGTGPFPPGITIGPAVYYNRAGVQPVSIAKYSNLDLSGGTRTFGGTDTTGISGALVYTGTLNMSTSTIDFNGANQIIPGITFNNLVVSGTGTKTANGNLTVNGLLSVRSTLKMGSYTLGGTVTSQTGAGWIQVQQAAGTSIPAKAWQPGIELDGTDQIIPIGSTFKKLKISGSGTKTTTADVTVADSLWVDSKLDLGTYAVVSTSALKTTGNGKIRTASISGTPIPASVTWMPRIEYYATSGTQNIMSGTYNSLRTSGAGSKRMTGNITVNDSLQLDSSSLLSLLSNTLTLNGPVYVANASVNKFVTNFSSSLAFGGTDATPLTMNLSVTSGICSLNNLTLNRPGCTLSIGSAKTNIYGTLNIQNGTLNTDNNLVLVSNTAGTARVGSLLTGADIIGTATVQRYIPAVSRRWRFISSPINGSTLTTLQSSMYVTGAGNAANGFDSTLSSAPSVYGYDESVITGDLNTGWVAASNITNPLNAGTGYRIFVRGDRSNPGRLTGSVTSQNEVTINWDGPLNKGNLSLPVSFTTSGTLSNDGWNFVGNPYASPYNWNAFYDAGGNAFNISPIVYVLDAQCNCYKSFNASSDAGTLTNGIIPSGSGFWVKATGALPSLTFTEQFKTGTNPINSIFKTSSEGQAFTLRMIADSISYDEVTIKYMDGTTTQLDSFDIPKLAASWVNIGSYGSDNVQLTLSARPFTTANDTIRLKATASTSGTYALHFSNENMPYEDKIFLIDNYTSQISSLKDTDTYSFTVTASVPSSQGLNRFYIVIDHSASLPVKLISFVARKTASRKVQLNWITATEINNDRFEIERSADNKTFERIGEVMGNVNTTSVSAYEFTDIQPLSLNYYRLKQVDKDGRFTYSTIRVVDLNKNAYESASLSVYPNPVVSTLIAEASGNVGLASYKIFNDGGRMTGSGNLADQKAEINMDRFESGIYYVEITDANDQATVTRIIKE
jgi:hypothetical protein